MRASEQRARQAEVRLAEATAERDAAVVREAAAAQEVAEVRQSSREEIARAREQLQVPCSIHTDMIGHVLGVNCKRTTCDGDSL
jgi:hypothetical protein